MKMLSYETEEINPSTFRKQRRREKSRDAARSRRNKECDIFQEICDTLPIVHDVIGQLDRSAVLRMVISYIKLRQSLPTSTHSNSIADVISDLSIKQENPLPLVTNEDYINALNGFLLIISPDYDILYASENVKEYLGLSHLDLIVQNMLSYTHEGDHDEIRNCFREPEGKSQRKSFFLRMKSTLTPNGKTTNLKSASYKVLRCSGMITSSGGKNDSSVFIAHVQPIPHPSNIQHIIDCKTFLSQHSPDMKFTYCHERMSEIFTYEPEALVGKSFYDYVHVLDVKAIEQSFQKLYRLSQIETTRYRFLDKYGGYHWLITQATVIMGNKNKKAQCVVCVHYVIGGSMDEKVIFSSQQLESVRQLQITEQATSSCLQAMTLSLPPTVYEEGLTTCDVYPVHSTVPEVEQTPEDDCSIVTLTFEALDENDERLCGDDVFFNAPSIGDPWPYTLNAGNGQEKLEDLFSYVAVDNLEAPQGPQDFCELPQPKWTAPNSQPSTSKSWNRQPPPSAPLSPCDSAYCGSPSSQAGLPFPELEPPDDRSGFSPTKRPFQVIPVPTDQYREQQENMRRGFIPSNDHQFAAKPRKRYLQAPDCRKLAEMPAAADSKRRCYDPSQVRLPNASQPNQGDNGIQFDLQQCVNVLLQPGSGYGVLDNGCVTFSPNFLLQPSADFEQTNRGREGLPRNSSGILPELSLHDCEVNAPLPTGPRFFPKGVECVHALDEVF
uniref:Uncharacterized protein n=2 Tax=Ciona savignyi TaxID=51511 RepID=H2YWW1_CIOSA